MQWDASMGGGGIYAPERAQVHINSLTHNTANFSIFHVVADCISAIKIGMSQNKWELNPDKSFIDCDSFLTDWAA